MKKKKIIVMILICLLIFMIALIFCYLNFKNKDKKNSLNSQEKVINDKDNMNEIAKNDYLPENISSSDDNNIENENSIDEEKNGNEIKSENKIDKVVEKESKNETNTNLEKDNSTDKKSESNDKEESIFLTDFENYNVQSNEVKISEKQAKQIAQIGFEESAKRIAGEGADNKESERVEITEVSPNNYFTRKYNEYDNVYTNIKRKCYIITRENEMGNGISIYIDVTTGLIIGGEAFGD